MGVVGRGKDGGVLCGTTESGHTEPCHNVPEPFNRTTPYLMMPSLDPVSTVSSSSLRSVSTECGCPEVR